MRSLDDVQLATCLPSTPLLHPAQTILRSPLLQSPGHSVFPSIALSSVATPSRPDSSCLRRLLLPVLQSAAHPSPPPPVPSPSSSQVQISTYTALYRTCGSPSLTPLLRVVLPPHLSPFYYPPLLCPMTLASALHPSRCSPLQIHFSTLAHHSEMSSQWPVLTASYPERHQSPSSWVLQSTDCPHLSAPLYFSLHSMSALTSPSLPSTSVELGPECTSLWKAPLPSHSTTQPLHTSKPLRSQSPAVCLDFQILAKILLLVLQMDSQLIRVSSSDVVLSSISTTSCLLRPPLLSPLNTYCVSFLPSLL